MRKPWVQVIDALETDCRRAEKAVASARAKRETGRMTPADKLRAEAVRREMSRDGWSMPLAVVHAVLAAIERLRAKERIR